MRVLSNLATKRRVSFLGFCALYLMTALGFHLLALQIQTSPQQTQPNLYEPDQQVEGEADGVRDVRQCKTLYLSGVGKGDKSIADILIRRGSKMSKKDVELVMKIVNKCLELEEKELLTVDEWDTKRLICNDPERAGLVSVERGIHRQRECDEFLLQQMRQSLKGMCENDGWCLTLVEEKKEADLELIFYPEELKDQMGLSVWFMQIYLYRGSKPLWSDKVRFDNSSACALNLAAQSAFMRWINQHTGNNEKVKPTTHKRIHVDREVQASKLRFQPKPDYPPLAKAARIQGVVHLEAVISRDGTIQDLKVLNGHPLLVKSALETVQKWAYEPTLVVGEAVEVTTEIEVRFALPD